MSAPTETELARGALAWIRAHCEDRKNLAAAFATIEALAADIAETTDRAEAKSLAEELAVDARHAAARMLEGRP